MQYLVKAKKIAVGGNDLLMRPLTRGAANDFRSRMEAAGDNADEQERIGLELIAANVTFPDGSVLDVDEVPPSDLIEILQLLVGGKPKSVSDFTPTP